MTFLKTWTALLTLVLVGTLAGQQGGAGVQEDPGDLAVYGRVVRPGTRESVPGARVTLIGSSGDVQERRRAAVTTDTNGRFGFTGLTAGRYTVGVVYPEESPTLFRGNKSLDLKGTEPPPDIELWMDQLSTVSGQVVGPEGEPVRGAIVEAMVRTWFNGAEWLRNLSLPGPEQRTEEDGRYSLRVPPGTYYLRVSPASESPFPFLHPDPNDPNARTTGNTPSTIVPFYYPGVPYPEDAIPLPVGPGADLRGINVSLVGSELMRLRFRLPLPEYVTPIPEPVLSYLADGALPVEGRLRPLGRGLLNVATYGIGLEAQGEDVYLTQAVPPGEYELLISYSRSLSDGVLRDFGRQDLIPIARVRITVSDAVSEDEVVDLGTIPEVVKVSVQGRAVLREMPSDEVDFGRLPIMSLSDTVLGTFGTRTGFSRTGTFIFKSVPPGLYQFLGFEQLPDGWYVASITGGGRDVLRDGLEVGGVEPGLIEVK